MRSREGRGSILSLSPSLSLWLPCSLSRLCIHTHTRLPPVCVCQVCDLCLVSAVWKTWSSRRSRTVTQESAATTETRDCLLLRCVCVSLHLCVSASVCLCVGGDFVHLYQYDCNMFKYRCIVMCVYVSMHKYALDMYLIHSSLLL